MGVRDLFRKKDTPRNIKAFELENFITYGLPEPQSYVRAKPVSYVRDAERCKYTLQEALPLVKNCLDVFLAAPLREFKLGRGESIPHGNFAQNESADNIVERLWQSACTSYHICRDNRNTSVKSCHNYQPRKS